MNTTRISLLAVALLLVGACSKDSDNKNRDSEAPGAARSSALEKPAEADTDSPSASDEPATIDYAFLAPVPADSPFLIAMLRPLPSDFLGYLRTGLTPLAGMAQLGISGAKEHADPLSKAILDEIDGKLSIDGLRSLGIDATPKMAMYAIGWSLAMRIELADGKTFAAVLDRIEKNGGKAMPRAELEGVSYRHFEEDDVAIALAVVDNQLVFGLMHANAREHVLPVLLGVEKPDKNMADAGAVQALVDKHKFMGMALGFIDTQALARTLTGQITGRSKRIMDASKVEIPPLSAVCQGEFAAMAAAVPRLSFGYRSASATGYDSVISMELRSDLAGSLAKLQGPGVDIGKLTAGQPVFAVGASLGLEQGKAWLQQKAAEIVAKPYQCEYLRELNEGMGEAARDLQMPLPAAAAGGHGLAAVVKELSVNDGIPSGKGFLAVGVGNPLALFAEMKKDNEELANITLEKGKPATAPTNVPGLGDATLMATDRWLGMAVGEGMVEAMNAALASKGQAGGPFFAMAYDYSRLLQFSQMMSGESNPLVAGMTKTLGKFLGYSTTSLHFAPDGITARLQTRIQ